jgi:hypothetical protein
MLAGLLFGLLAFPALQLAGRLFMQEGLITFWIVRSLGLPRDVAAATAAATSTPEIAPAPVRTRPLAVMVDNHPDARPQSGVAEADTVWEALVEGGLTRDMLIFRGAESDEIGPVRSARPYFLLWAREADAVYAHVGGSDEALKDLETGKYGLDNVDEFRYGKTFWRDQARSAPHNTYTTTDRLRALVAAEGWDEETDAVDASLRGAPAAGGAPAGRIGVSYMHGGADAEFRWNAATGSYDLWRSGRVARDRDGKVISPRTVAVLEADVVPIDDPHAKGLIGVANIGAGDAMVFRDGLAYRGTWKKTSANDPTRVYGEDGLQIPFAPGQVWYSVVGADRGGGVQFDP